MCRTRGAGEAGPIGLAYFFPESADKTAAAARFGTPKMDETALREALGLPPAVEQMALF